MGVDGISSTRPRPVVCHCSTTETNWYQASTIFTVAVRLHECMDALPTVATMTENDLRIAEIIAGERSRLRNFIRKRVPNEADAEDLLQDVSTRSSRRTG